MHTDTAELQQMNRDLLSQIQATTGLRISSDRWAHWRPTRRVTGNIPGMPWTVTCWATDGNVAWFERPHIEDMPSETPQFFFGHTHRFEWTRDGVPVVGCPPSFYAKEGTPTAKGKAKPKVRKKSKAEILEDIINSI